jgi:eukaryotic-like serine/threonine-protein kinase
MQAISKYPLNKQELTPIPAEDRYGRNLLTQVQLKMVGHYRVLEEVGVGGLGRVFKGVDTRTGRFVAIKMLHTKFIESRKFLGIFHREMMIISRLYHKNIVNYIDGNFEPPNCYIITEFVDGFSIYSLLKKTRTLPPLVALCVTFDMLQGIDYLHLHDAIHADLSAPNVLLDLSGRVLVTDFGLACYKDIEDYRSFMIGTPGYYSPEHVTETSIVPQTDLFCAALILHEMLTGKKAVPASQDRKEVVANLKSISLSRLPVRDWRMQAMIKKLLQASLQFHVSKRVENAESMMFGIYTILKKYNIRYSRHAIFQFLCDQGFSKQPFKGHKQDIYKGYR